MSDAIRFVVNRRNGAQSGDRRAPTIGRWRQGWPYRSVEARLPRAQAKRVIEVRDSYVTPGLIDFHVHSFCGRKSLRLRIRRALYEHRSDDGDRCGLVRAD